MNIVTFIKGKQQCWECGGSGQSSRGYGDSSPCGTCGETGIIEISRGYLILESLKGIFLSLLWRYRNRERSLGQSQ